MLDTYTFHLEGPIAPKARPRVTDGHAYMPESYRVWKELAIAAFADQWRGQPLAGVAAIIFLRGKHSRRSDGDNVEGALLDALVQAGVLKDDNLAKVGCLHVELEYSKDPPTTEILIAKV